MMLDEKIIRIASITIPVFTLTLVGNLLARKKMLPDAGKKTLSWLTYNLALPALIFNSLMSTDSGELFSTDLLILSLAAIGITGSLFFGVAKLLKLSPTKTAATTYCSYWGNNGYMGIPLAAFALPESGKALAAVINGMATPFFISLSLFLMYKALKRSSSGQTDKKEMKKEAVKTFFNPVMLTLIFGSLLSWIRSSYLSEVSFPPLAQEGWSIIMETVKMLGEMGLPLALILVGSNLHIEEVSRDRVPLILTIAGKLLIAPLVVWLGIQWFFPDMSADAKVAIVLLNAVPGAVASYIISDRLEIEQEFVSSSLVISTALSIITLPVWLYIIL